MSKWWITTDVLARGGAKVLGPFESQELALNVRTYVEKVPQHERDGIARQQATFWVDQEGDPLYPCAICAKRFGTYDALEAHQRVEHLGGRRRSQRSMNENR